MSFANGYHVGLFYKRLVYIHKNVEPILSLVPRSKGSGIAQVVETSNAESPTPVYVYRKHSWQRTTKSLEANEGCIQYTSWGVPVALFLTTFARTARFLHCQNQSVQKRLNTKCSLPPLSTQWGFRWENRRCKYSKIYRNHQTFIEKSEEKDCFFDIKSYLCTLNS